MNSIRYTLIYRWTILLFSKPLTGLYVWCAYFFMVQNFYICS